jgi:hypothetical protein
MVGSRRLRLVACVACKRDMSSAYKIVDWISEGRDQSGHLCADGRIQLKYTLRKHMWVWSGFIWLRTGSSCGPLWTFRFHTGRLSYHQLLKDDCASWRQVLFVCFLCDTSYPISFRRNNSRCRVRTVSGSCNLVRCEFCTATRIDCSLVSKW